MPRAHPFLNQRLVGHTSMGQLEEDLKAMAVQEKLSDALMWEIDACSSLRAAFVMFKLFTSQEGVLFRPVQKLHMLRNIGARKFFFCWKSLINTKHCNSSKDRVHMRNRLPIFSSEQTEASSASVGEIGEPIP